MEKIYKKRILITGIFLMGVACFFIYRMASLHFSDRISISPRKSYNTRRGYIKDIKGNILAVSIERNSLYANPEEITEPADLAKKLSQVTGYNEKYILGKIGKNKRFVWIKRKLEDAEAERIMSLNLKGLHFIKEYFRAYPHDQLAANILGFVDIDNNGLDGIEYKYNDVLLTEDKPGIFTQNEYKRSFLSIVLTIDKYIQHISEREIKEAVINNKALQGTALVLEVKTGKILAIAKYPGFNPNYYNRYSAAERGNFTVANSFEPGSTLKIMALAAILEKNPKALQSTYICDGSFVIGDTTVKCTKVHGRVNMNEIIKYSCNVGIMQAIKGVSKEDYFSVLKKFGFGEKTGIELPGESSGILRPVKDWSGLSKYSISIGQEISMNSLQLAAAFGAIANGGVYIYPTIIERIEREDGTPAHDFSPRVKGRIMTADNASRIIRMMRGVVTGGTGEMADFEYYNPAGKTGTAQKSMRRGGYIENKYLISFIGLAPLNNPSICVLVVLDEPGTGASGGEAAAPVFSRIAKRVLAYRGDRNSNITSTVPYKSNIKETGFDGRTMPDFTGLLMPDSVRLLIKIQKSINIKYSFTGSGRVYKQDPLPGEKLDGKDQIMLHLRNQ